MRTQTPEWEKLRLLVKAVREVSQKGSSEMAFMSAGLKGGDRW